VGLEIFNLGGSCPVPLKLLVDELTSVLGVTPRVQWAPRQPGDVQHTWADLAKSAAVLGYAPRTALREGLGRFVDWFQETHARQR
jgi:UDP-glucuronate 4-epimerase